VYSVSSMRRRKRYRNRWGWKHPDRAAELLRQKLVHAAGCTTRFNINNDVQPHIEGASIYLCSCVGEVVYEPSIMRRAKDLGVSIPRSMRLEESFWQDFVWKESEDDQEES